MELSNEMIFQLGVEVGRKQLMDHIQRQHMIGKPAEINGELYWFTDSRQHLLEIIDNLGNESDTQKENQYIVPMHKVFDGKCIEFKVIITAKTPYEAWCIAYVAFGFDEKEIVGGWRVFAEYNKYQQFKGDMIEGQSGI